MRSATVLVLATLLLAACGKVGPLEMPPPESEQAEPSP
jgi:predicted small lipoprotein YifL